MRIDGGNQNFNVNNLTELPVEIKKEDLKGVNKQILNCFAGFDDEFSSSEVGSTLQAIFSMDVKHGKKEADGILTGDEIQQGLKEFTGRKFKEKELVEFANQFLNVVHSKVTKAKADVIEAANGFQSR